MSRHLDAFKTSQRLAIVSAFVLSAAAGVTTATGAAEVARFVLSALAIAALAAVVGQSLEQVSEHLSPGAVGVLQSSLGNLPELFVSIFALRAGLRVVVQSALVGSVLSSVLLVLGLAFLTGGARHGVQSFRPEAPRMLVTLLTLAVGALLVPTLADHLETPASHHTEALSDVAAAILFVVYLASVPFWLSRAPSDEDQGGLERTHGTGPSTETSGAQPPWPLGTAVVVLVIAGAASAVVSDWFVASLERATEGLGITTEFTGLVVVAIASNAVENVAGVRFAWTARADYAISAILASPLQVALLLTPVLVLTSSFFGPHQLTLVLPPLLVAALAVAVVVTTVVIYDGEYSWLEGVALIALYAIVATGFWWG